MKTLLLIFSALMLSFCGYSQSYLGKSKEEIKQLAEKTYDEVEVISENENSFKLQCDEDTAAADEAFVDLSCPPHNEE